MAVAVKNMQYLRNELLKSVSHDLRIPLSRLRFSLELLKEGDPNALLNRIAEMEADISELEGMVSEVLSSLHADDDTLEVPVEINKCELNFELPLIVNNFKKISTKKIITHIHENKTALYTFANKKSLQRVLQNLLDNANKFASSTIQVSLQKNSTAYKIIIEDDGEGIPVEKREQVFESQVQLKNSNTGYGLGLSIVKKIVNFHGWKIKLADSILGGLKVVLVIPN